LIGRYVESHRGFYRIIAKNISEEKQWLITTMARNWQN